MTQLIAPNRFENPKQCPSVFLAGSIEMGKAINWQDKANRVLHEARDDILVYNPRRENWDSSWEQSIDNPQFYEQVSWELDHLMECDLAIFYFQPDTMSPITLMELAYRLAKQKDSQKILVCAPKGFWRLGNIEIICQRHGIDIIDDLDDMLDKACKYIKNYKD